jgi:hypothetical protein
MGFSRWLGLGISVALVGLACSGKSVSDRNDGRGDDGGGGTSGAGSATGGSGNASDGSSSQQRSCETAWDCSELRDDGSVHLMACDPGTRRCVTPCGGFVYDESRDPAERELDEVRCGAGKRCMLQEGPSGKAGACYPACDIETLTGCASGSVCVEGGCRAVSAPDEPGPNPTS